MRIDLCDHPVGAFHRRASHVARNAEAHQPLLIGERTVEMTRKAHLMIIRFNQVNYRSVGKFNIATHHHTGGSIFGVDLSERIVKE